MRHRLTTVMIESPKRTKGVPHPVTNQCVQRLLKVRCRLRTKAMLRLALFAGFRAHEIAKVKGECGAWSMTHAAMTTSSTPT